MVQAQLGPQKPHHNYGGVFLNPSRDVFNITFTSETVQDLRLRILNVMGEEIVKEDLQQFIGEYTKQINLQDNAKGIYFLEIETSNGLIRNCFSSNFLK